MGIMLLRFVNSGLCAIWTGWVLMTIWGWHIAPWLHIAPTLKQAIGLDIRQAPVLL